jgi:hypothetical protein
MIKNVGVEDDAVKLEGAIQLRIFRKNEGNPDFTQFVSIFKTVATGLIDHSDRLPVIQGWLVRMLVLTRFHTTINNVRIIH